LRNPQPIDFDAMERAAFDAAYVITEIRLDLSGEVVTHDCPQCSGAERQFLRLETGQELELRGARTEAGMQDIRGVVVGWDSEHPRLSVQ